MEKANAIGTDASPFCVEFRRSPVLKTVWEVETYKDGRLLVGTHMRKPMAFSFWNTLMAKGYHRFEPAPLDYRAEDVAMDRIGDKWRTR